MTGKYKSELEALAKEGALHPQEALLSKKSENKSLYIGVPKEVALQENRVPITPEAVNLLINNGHRVRVETQAGDKAKFTDKDYSEAGAEISYSSKDVYEADMIVKVQQPTLEEISLIKPGKTLFSSVHVKKLEPDYLKKLNEKNITSIAYGLLEDKVGGMPVVRAMSEIAGSTALLIAAEYLSTTNNGRGLILGGITGVSPAKVIIIGAGTVGEYAARTGLGLGADIQVFDSHLYKLRRIKHAIGYQINTSVLGTTALSNSLKDADVVIGALRGEKGKNICVVTEEMVEQMKPESIIIDVSIDQGGCFETSEMTSHSNPVYRKYDVIHYCVPNIASRVATSASRAFSNIISPILLQIADVGGVSNMIHNHKWFMKGVYTYNKGVSNEYIARQFNLPYKDLNLLMAARF